jgi:hypothetical protein
VFVVYDLYVLHFSINEAPGLNLFLWESGFNNATELMQLLLLHLKPTVPHCQFINETKAERQ